MKRNLLFVSMFVLLLMPLFSASGQIAIVNSPFLYKPSENYNDCDNQNPSSCYLDTTVVNTTHRDVPVRIRFPRGRPDNCR